MIRAALILFLISALMVIAVALSGPPGQASLEWLGWRLDMTAAAAVLCIRQRQWAPPPQLAQIHLSPLRWAARPGGQQLRRGPHLRAPLLCRRTQPRKEAQLRLS